MKEMCKDTVRPAQDSMALTAYLRPDQTGSNMRYVAFFQSNLYPFSAEYSGTLCRRCHNFQVLPH